MEEKQDSITLKWGTLKAWNLHGKSELALLQRYFDLGVSAGCMTQHDSPEQKELLCQIIDGCNAETVYLDWDDVDVSKDDAKRYVMEYGKRTSS